MVVVLVSGLASFGFGGFAWAFHAVARLRSSVSISVSGDRVGCCILAKWVFLAVSSIPFWSVWVRPWAFGIPFVIFHNVITSLADVMLIDVSPSWEVVWFTFFGGNAAFVEG